MEDFDVEEEYISEEVEIDLDEDYNPLSDLSDIWHPDVADTFGLSY